MKVLSTKKIGVVAHFYMDPQVQGVLTSAAQRWPNIHISDSLVMADSAVRMAEAGCQAVAVLGVDFMSENVRAILDEAGHSDVKVCCIGGSSADNCCTNKCLFTECIRSKQGHTNEQLNSEQNLDLLKAIQSVKAIFVGRQQPVCCL